MVSGFASYGAETGPRVMHAGSFTSCGLRQSRGALTGPKWCRIDGVWPLSRRRWDDDFRAPASRPMSFMQTARTTKLPLLW